VGDGDVEVALVTGRRDVARLGDDGVARHLWTLRDGRVVAHASYPDTARYVAALVAVAA
jgi:ketosteroid isomerase-like protein